MSKFERKTGNFVQTLALPSDKRILVVSDIHGFANYLEGVLQKAHYTPDDILIIVGDMIEKGPESLKTVRYILKLKKENPHVYATIGNVDYARILNFYDNSPGAGKRFLDVIRWTKRVWKRGMVLDMLDEMGISPDSLLEENMTELMANMYDRYREELDFLWNLPAVISAGNFIFVHGGIPTDDLSALREEDFFSYLKVDAFASTDVHFEKTVVVGHWPVHHYRNDMDCVNPLFDYEKHIIAIDGGCALRDGAQLNALLLPNIHADIRDITYVAFDDYPTLTATHAQTGRAATLVIHYFDCEVELLSEDLSNGLAVEETDTAIGNATHKTARDMVQVRQLSSGREFSVPKSFLYQKGDKYDCSDYTDALLEVAPGDTLSVIARTSTGCIAKKDGVIGWYRPAE